MQDSIFTYNDEVFCPIHNFNITGFKKNLAENASVSFLAVMPNKEFLQKFPSHTVMWTFPVKILIQKFLVKWKGFDFDTLI